MDESEFVRYCDFYVVPEIFSPDDFSRLEKIAEETREELEKNNERKENISFEMERGIFYSSSELDSLIRRVSGLVDDWTHAGLDLSEYYNRGAEDSSNSLVSEIFSKAPKVSLFSQSWTGELSSRKSFYHLDIENKVPEIVLSGSTLGIMLSDFAHEYAHYVQSRHLVLMTHHHRRIVGENERNLYDRIYASLREGQADSCEAKFWDVGYKFSFPHSFELYLKERLSHIALVADRIGKNYAMSVPSSIMEISGIDEETLAKPVSNLSVGATYFLVHELEPHQFFMESYQQLMKFMGNQNH